jgi:hypothetical protein
MRRESVFPPWKNLPLLVVGIMLMALTLSACGTGEAPPATAAPAQSPTPPPSAIPTADPVPTTTPVEREGTRLADEAVSAVMVQLLRIEVNQRQDALDQILAAGDTRFIAVLIEMIRAAQIGLVPRGDYPALIEALEALSGVALGDDWPAWVEWYGGTDLEPPPGFTSWKGQLLARIDPAFADFLQDDHPSRIRVEEIMWGGVAVDGIPALDNPAMIPADQADYLEPGEPVFGLALNGDARAYPLRIMDWHEMANDVVGGVPVSLAYCTLCGAGIAFDGRASDGNTYTFGSSGFLFRSNKLMYDRQTRSLWNQLTGEPVLGELVVGDVRLSLLPVVLTSWSDWQDQHPDTQVLSLDTGYNRVYELGAAYGDYFAGEGTMFPVWQRSDELPAKARVYVLHLDGVPKAYALSSLVSEGVVNDTLGETGVVLVARRGVVDVEGINLRAGPVTYNSGGEVRAYERGGHTFSPGEAPDTLLDERGRVWEVTEGALVGPEGETAPRLGGHLAYWFGWFAFFPNTQLYP